MAKMFKLFRRKDSLRSGRVAAWRMELPSGKLYFDPVKAIQLGLNPKDVTHYRHFTELIHPEDYTMVMEAMTEHLKGHTKRYNVQYRIRATDGQYHTYLDSGVVTARGNEGEYTVLGATVDITA